jgi:hypothetical protein
MNLPSTTPDTLPRAMIRRLAALSALALTVFGVSVATASAGESERIVANGGTAKFLHEGEILYVSDNIKDGWNMQAELLNLTDYEGDEGSWWLIDRGADGDPSEANLSIRDGSKLWLRLCYTRKGEDDECSRWQTAVA